MKELFSGYYRPDSEQFKTLWQEAIFILDANVLLNLYRYSSDTRSEWLNTLGQLAGRIWIPYQAALEYQRNRANVVIQQKERFSAVKNIVAGVLPELERSLRELQFRDRQHVIEPENLLTALRPHIDSYLAELEAAENSQEDVAVSDTLRDRIDKLLSGRIGQKPTQIFVDDACKEGEWRYAASIPPGYMDDKKKFKKDESYTYDGITYAARFGDVILWKQILEYTKKTNLKYVILLTDDKKEDWWWIVNSHGDKNLGPRPELVAEIRGIESVRSFYMYSSERFLRFARDYLNANISEEAIRDAKLFSDRSATASRMVQYEALVERWFTRKNPGSQIIRSGKWPDFIVIPESGGKIGVEVRSSRAAKRDSILREFERARNYISSGDIDLLNLVIVVDDDHNIDRFLGRTVGQDIPDGVQIITGFIEKGEDGSLEFVDGYYFG